MEMYVYRWRMRWSLRKITTATKKAMAIAEYISWLGAEAEKVPYAFIDSCWSRSDWSRRQISTRPRPLRRVASGSSSGSA